MATYTLTDFSTSSFLQKKIILAKLSINSMQDRSSLASINNLSLTPFVNNSASKSATREVKKNIAEQVLSLQRGDVTGIHTRARITHRERVGS